MRLEELEDLVKYLTKAIGLKDFKVDVRASFNSDCYDILLSKQLERGSTINGPLGVAEHLVDQEVITDYAEQIKELEALCAEYHLDLQKANQQLAFYKEKESACAN